MVVWARAVELEEIEEGYPAAPGPGMVLVDVSLDAWQGALMGGMLANCVAGQARGKEMAKELRKREKQKAPLGLEEGG